MDLNELSPTVSYNRVKSNLTHEMISNDTSGNGFKAIHSTNGDENCSMDINSDFNHSNAKQYNTSDANNYNDPNKVNLVGGHINQITIESSDIIKKKTSKFEVDQYKLIFDDSLEAKGLNT